MTALADKPERNVPRAMFVGLTVVALANLAFCLAAAALVGREKLGSAPLPHLDVVQAAFGTGARLVLAAVFVVATASLLNMVLGAVPRMLMDMARNGEAFPILARTNARGVPWVATLFVAALPLAGLGWAGGDVNRIVPLLVAAASAWLVSYMLAHVSLLVLRWREPGAARLWRSPGVPLPQVVAIGGMGYVIANAAPAPELVQPVFLALAAVLGFVAVVGGLWVALVMRRAPFSPAAGAAPGQASGAAER
jgi:amino acid transporter